MRPALILLPAVLLAGPGPAQDLLHAVLVAEVAGDLAAHPLDAEAIAGVGERHLHLLEVADEPVDPASRPANEDEAGDTFFLRAENQYDVGTRTNYYRYLKRLESESALQDGAQLTFGFDPHDQTFSFHRLLIHRNGKTLDRLAEQQFKVIQRAF